MMRLFIFVFLFLIFSSCELSLINALPFPLDRTPLVLIVSVFFFQFLDVSWAGWWIILHGFTLDLLNTSFVPLEVLSYASAALVLVLASRHLFTNRSFWGVLGTLTLCLFTITSIEIIIAMIQHLSQSFTLSIKEIFILRSWSWGLSILMLFVLFHIRELMVHLRKWLLNT